MAPNSRVRNVFPMGGSVLGQWLGQLSGVIRAVACGGSRGVAWQTDCRVAAPESWSASAARPRPRRCAQPRGRRHPLPGRIPDAMHAASGGRRRRQPPGRLGPTAAVNCTMRAYLRTTLFVRVVCAVARLPGEHPWRPLWRPRSRCRSNDRRESAIGRLAHAGENVRGPVRHLRIVGNGHSASLTYRRMSLHTRAWLRSRVARGCAACPRPIPRRTFGRPI